MDIDLIDKVTGKTVQASSNSVNLSSPNVVRLDVDRSQITNLQRVGDDLQVHIANGETVNVSNFYTTTNGVSNDLVLRDASQNLWRADTTALRTARFMQIKDLGELTEAAAAGGGGALGGSILPIVGGVAGAGGAVAAVSSGGSDDRPSAPAVDTTAPAAPTALFSSAGTIISGRGEAGATIQIRDATGGIVGTGTVAADGTFSITLAQRRINSENFTVTQTDTAGNVSQPTTATAPDLTPPPAPTATVAADGASVSGTGERGATITIVDSEGQVVATAIVGDDGTYVALLRSVDIDGGTLTVTQTDPAGNISPSVTVETPDLLAPIAPIASVSIDGITVTGTGEAGATVTIRDALGTVLATAVVAANGSFTATLPTPLVNGEPLDVQQADAHGNLSPSVEILAPDITAPLGLTALLNAEGTIVTGLGEAGATVTVRDATGTAIGTATVARDGGYAIILTTPQANGQTITVVQADPASNASSPVTILAPDITAPLAPLGSVATDGASIMGTGEAGATLVVRDNLGTVLGTVIVAPDGSFNVTLVTPLVNGETLQLAQRDAAGNVSTTTNLTAPDIILPAGLTAAIDPSGSVVTGTGEPGATITVFDPLGASVGTARVNSFGRFSVLLTRTHSNAEILQVTQADAAGNASPPVPVTAPDFTEPPAPTAAVSADGLMAFGSGEIGATITIRDAGGAVIGTTTVDGSGNYSATLTPPQTNGEVLSVRQTDAIGNDSLPASATAPDITPPSGLTATVNGDGTIVSGTGEAGATIVVRDPLGNAIGTTIVASNGAYSVTLAAQQANGETLEVAQTDAAGNNAAPIPALAPDITAPAAVSFTVSPDGTTVSGTGEPGATVSITNSFGSVVGTGPVAFNGSFTIILTTPQSNGGTVNATQADAAGNVSLPATAIAPDITPPNLPAATLDTTGSTVTGTGEPGATITITDPFATIIGTGSVDAFGNFSVVLSVPQINNQVLSVVQTDAAGNPSPALPLVAPDLTPPGAPAAIVAGDGASISGVGEPGATLIITDPVGTVIGSVTVTGGGTFTTALVPPQVNGELLGLTQTDLAGNVSPEGSATAPDLVPGDSPDAPTAVITANGTIVFGTGQPGAIVNVAGAGGAVIGAAIVDPGGIYVVILSSANINGEELSVTQTDGEGDVSPPTVVIAPDLTPPAAPVASIDATGLIVSGTGEVGATVRVSNSVGTVLGVATVTASGNFSIVLTSAQLNGEALAVTQSDAAANVSPTTPIIAPDVTAPSAPTINISADGTTVTGLGEPGATITVTGPGGTTVGSATISPGGTYVVILITPQANGELLTATAADAAGNVSASVTATAPDITAPLAPIATVDASGTVVTGTGEAGASVIVRDSLGNVVGTVVVAVNGSYAVTLSTPFLNGELLQVSQTDVAGNVSLSTNAAAPDFTAPSAPTAIIDGLGTIVTGTGEPGATINVLDPAGTIVGIAIVAGDGSYVATLIIPQANGQALTVEQADAAGNVSPGISLTAPDITPPALPTAIVINADGTVVTGSGEPNATVEIRDAGGAVIGSGLVAANGSFAVALTSPQTAGQLLSVNQHDVAGNISGAVPLTAPIDIDAFDNSATASINLEPFATGANLGTANYLALVSLGLLNLNAQVLATPNVQFTVHPGHSLDAVFTYDALLSIGAASNYSVVVQRFDGANWVAVAGPGNSTLLTLNLLGGNLVSTETLGPGEYRAFVAFDGLAGVGLLGGLNVSGTDINHLDVGAAVPDTITGNVITDPGPGGVVDVVSPSTHVQSVTIGGVTTAVVTNNMVIDGAWGTLTINLDGSYSYTPDANAAAIGKTDSFTYTLIDTTDGELESATLAITIGSPDLTSAPIAVNDTATATATFDHVVTTTAPVLDSSFATPTALIITGAKMGSVNDSFTVGPNSTADITLTAIRQGGLSVLPTYIITVTDQHGTVVGTLTQTAVAGLPLGSGVSLTLHDLPSGTYHYTVSSTNILGTGYGTNVYVGETVTHLDQFSFVSASTVEGNLLDNDTTGGTFATIRMQSGGSLVDIGDTPLTIAGVHGTLTIDATGDYSYHPNSSLAYSSSDPVDSFVYQIVQPNGDIATAHLDITIDINNGATPASASITMLDAPDDMSGLAETVSLAMFSREAADTDGGHDPSQSAGVTLSEDDDGMSELLGRYLDSQHNDTTAEGSAAPTDGHTTVELVPPDAPDDPLNYLTLPSDSDHDRLTLLHAA